jgi:hypothetical protein
MLHKVSAQSPVDGCAADRFSVSNGFQVQPKQRDFIFLFKNAAVGGCLRFIHCNISPT